MSDTEQLDSALAEEHVDIDQHDEIQQPEHHDGDVDQNTKKDDNDDNDEQDLADQEAEIEAMKARVQEMEAEAARIQALEQKEGAGNDGQEPGKDQAQTIDPQEADARSVYVGNVDYAVTPEELQETFASCGVVNRVTIPCNKHTGHPKGFAYLEFADKESVQNAVMMNGSELHGREIKVTEKRTNVPGFKRGGGRGGGRGGRGRGRGRGGGFGAGGGGAGFGGHNGMPQGGNPMAAMMQAMMTAMGGGHQAGGGFARGGRGRGRGSYRSRSATFAPY